MRNTLPAWQWPILMAVGVLLFWLLPAIPWLADLIQPFQPDWALKLRAIVPSPPPFGLRVCLALFGALLTLWLVYLPFNFKAYYDKDMGTAKSLTGLLAVPEHHDKFMRKARFIDRVRLVLIGIIFLWGEATVLGVMQGHDKTLIASHVWPWLLAIL